MWHWLFNSWKEAASLWQRAWWSNCNGPPGLGNGGPFAYIFHNVLIIKWGSIVQTWSNEITSQSTFLFVLANHDSTLSPRHCKLFLVDIIIYNNLIMVCNLNKMTCFAAASSIVRAWINVSSLMLLVNSICNFDLADVNCSSVLSIHMSRIAKTVELNSVSLYLFMRFKIKNLRILIFFYMETECGWL